MVNWNFTATYENDDVHMHKYETMVQVQRKSKETTGNH